MNLFTEVLLLLLFLWRSIELHSLAIRQMCRRQRGSTCYQIIAWAYPVNTGRFQTLIKIRANAVCCIHVSTVLSSQSVNHYQSLFCSHQMPIFSAKMHQIQFRLVLRRRHAELRLQCSISWWGRGWLPNPQERPALANHAYMASIHCHHHHHVRLFKYNDKQSVFTSKFITLTSEALRCLIDVSHNWAVINLRSYRLTPHWTANDLNMYASWSWKLLMFPKYFYCTF